MTGFSAHAEIDPMPGNDAGVDARLLRPRGDRPDLLVLTRYAGMASPPTRRSPRFEIITDFCLSGFSAHAEIDPPLMPVLASIVGLLRPRGDRPAD